MAFEAVEAPPIVMGPTGTVELHKEAYVRGPKIYLGDIADVAGPNARALASLEVSGAAAPGGVKRLNAALLEARIKNAGFDTGEVTVEGAPSVLATTLHLEVTPEAIAQDLRDFMEAEMPWDPCDATIDVVPPSQDFMVPEGQLELAWWLPPQYRWVGRGSARGEIRVDGQVKQTFLCRIGVEAYTDVVVAAADIPRQSVIRPGDVEVRKEAVSALPTGYVSDPAEAVGMLARNTMFPGQPLTKRKLVKPTLVKRNQTVIVEVRAGALLVRGRARAMRDGCAGDVVPCRNNGSKEEFTGVLREDGVVVVE